MIKAYSNATDYLRFQSIRPDYSKAVSVIVILSKRFAPAKKKLSVIDLCGGTGTISKKFAQSVGGLKELVIVDINKIFLETVQKSGFSSEKFTAVNNDVLKFETKNKFDLVFAVFAYHHIQNSEKMEFVKKAHSLLNTGGILVLAEIFFENQDACYKYYSDLFGAIQRTKQTPGLKQFLEETARSSDFEFKVSKGFSDEQFHSAGFKLIHEEKVWPAMDSSPNGMFVQIYSI